MELLRVKLLSEHVRPAGGTRKIHIAVHASYAYLADLLGKAFEGQQDVEVVVDPTMGDRGPRERPAPADRQQAAAEPRRTSRRKGTRRRPKGEQSVKPISRPRPGST